MKKKIAASHDEQTDPSRFHDQPAFHDRQSADGESRRCESRWRPMTFFLRSLYAVIFCLLLLIAEKGAFGQELHEWTERGLTQVFERQINFVKMKKGIEELFGSADLAFFLPNETLETEKAAKAVSARVLTGFSETKTGIQIEAASHTAVVSDVDGVVIFAGKKADTAQTVIVQTEDGTEYWYGELEELKLRVYDTVEQHEIIGAAGARGQYYFAVRKDGKFIDPKQVLPLEY